MKTLITFGALMSGILLAGCATEKKTEPVPVGQLMEYRDPGIGFSIKHPEGWIINAEVGRARFYNDAEVARKFLDPTDVAPIGVEIAIDVIKAQNPTGRAKEIKDELAAQGYQLGKEETIQIGELSGTKVPYTANYGKGNVITGHRVFLLSDSAIYYLGFGGFGDLSTAYAAIFDVSLGSFTPPKPKASKVDETLPSEVLVDYDAKLFSFRYPENFEFTNPSKGTNEAVVELRGYRNDCTIRFDLFGAKGLGVEKVFEQNKGRYRAKSTGKATISGAPAQYLSYSPTAQVESRAYFVVKNDKVLRVTMNWYKPQQEIYLPVFEGMLNSVRMN